MEAAAFDLRRHSFFGGLLDEQIERIVALMRMDSHGMGEAVIVEGDRSDRLYFILDGQVEVSRKGVALSFLQEGSTFGEMEVLDIMPVEATITALTPVRLMSLSNAGLHELSKKDPATFAMLIMNLARDLSRRLRAMNRRVTGADAG